MIVEEMSKERKSLSSRFEALALTALHAFPTLYCQTDLLEQSTTADFIVGSYRQELEARLSAMPAWERIGLIYIWPPAMVLMAAAQTMVSGRIISRRYHRNVAKQFVEQIALAFRRHIPVRFYYLFELHEPQNRRNAHAYIHRAYLKRSALYDRLYRSNPERELRAKLLNDKKAFDQFLSQHHLPATRLIAFAENGQLSFDEPGLSVLPAINLFVKPYKANGGRGAESWHFTDGKFSGPGGLLLKPDELADRIAGLSRKRPHLVQECLQNHPDLQDLSAGALSTLRMYTCWNEAGEVEHLFTMLRMSQDPRNVVDNVCRGGLAASVDPATGTLGRATDGSIWARRGWHDFHAFTGARITGRRIPFWKEALDVAMTAHRLIDAPYFVGWDIAITSNGPVIVEGNKSPDIEVEQRLSGPWGNQRFGQVLAYHLKMAGEQGQGSGSGSGNRFRVAQRIAD